MFLIQTSDFDFSLHAFSFHAFSFQPFVLYSTWRQPGHSYNFVETSRNLHRLRRNSRLLVIYVDLDIGK